MAGCEPNGAMKLIDKLFNNSGKPEDAPASRCGLLPMPPRTHTQGGEERRIGIEIEFSGLKLDEISEVLIETLDAQAKPVSDYETEIETPDLGTWRVELDNAYLKQLGREHAEVAEVNPEADDGASLPESLLALVAEKIVPFEVVTAPLPISRLSDVCDVIRRLGNAGAKGTRHAKAYAFGIHMNPEMPALDAVTVRRHLQAFLCLQDWLKLRCDVDFSRRVTPYIDSFPTKYIRQVIAPDYAPDMDQLIDDYLAHNPTRNRALDMLPMFAQIDEGRVRAQVDDERVQARPTHHYRLPNCLIDEPNWNLGLAWRDWLQVEYLADEPQRLDAICAAYDEFLASPTDRLLKDWTRRCSDEFLIHELY